MVSNKGNEVNKYQFFFPNERVLLCEMCEVKV